MKETYTTEEYREMVAKGTKAKAKVKRRKSAAKAQLEKAIQAHRIKELEKATGQQVIPEHAFHPERKWRFDFYLPHSNIAIEVEGGVWTNGRHTRSKGYMGDMEKYSEAAAMGILVLRFTPDQLLQPKAIRIIKQAIKQVY